MDLSLTPYSLFPSSQLFGGLLTSSRLPAWRSVFLLSPDSFIVFKLIHILHFSFSCCDELCFLGCMDCSSSKYITWILSIFYSRHRSNTKTRVSSLTWVHNKMTHNLLFITYRESENYFLRIAIHFMLGLETGKRMNSATLKLEFQRGKSSLLIPR